MLVRALRDLLALSSMKEPGLVGRSETERGRGRRLSMAQTRRKTETRMESEEEETQSELFLAPSGDIFKDKVSMIRHLIDKQGPLEHIIRLWRSLDTESWMVDNHQVPLGWKIRFDCELNQDEYLSPRMEVLKSREDILSLASVTSQSDESDKLLAHYIEKWSSLKV